MFAEMLDPLASPLAVQQDFLQFIGTTFERFNMF